MRWHSSAPVRHPPGFVQPCLPTNRQTVPTGPEWVYEIKHDGYRFICRRDGDGARVFSRRGNDHTDRAPGIVEALMALKVKSITIDGEGVVCGPDGVTDFNRLRAALGRKGSRQAFLYAFDLLELDGIDLRREPWETRRATLTSVLRKPVDGVRLCEHIDGTDGMTVFGHACRMGSKASSPSGGIGLIVRDGRRIGSR